MPEKKLARSVAAATLPRLGQRTELLLLQLPCTLGRRRDRIQRRSIRVQRPQIQPVLAAVPIAYLRGVQREVGILIAEQMAGPHVVADVVDGRASLGQSRADVEPFGHRSADPSGAANIDVDVAIGAGRSSAAISVAARAHWCSRSTTSSTASAQRVAVRGVHATGDRPVEPQAGQMSSDRGVDDVGRRFVLARSAEHRRNIDARDVRFSHAG